MVPGDQHDRDRRRRAVRRWILISYFGVVSVVIAVISVRITIEALRDDPVDPSMQIGCEEGLTELMASLDRARQQACSADVSESEALRRFYDALEPTWSKRGSIRASCAGKPDLAETFEAVEQLTYAEEHAVRRNAVEVGDLRVRVRRMLQQHAGTAGTTP